MIGKGSSAIVRLMRSLLLGVVPSLIAFAVETTEFASLGSRWLLMVAAVIVSAANGGMEAGLIATITSASLVWWYLIPPGHALGPTQPFHYLSVAVFLAIGFAISLLHERLRRSKEGVEAAMRELGESQQLLQGVLDNSPNAIVIKSIEGRYLIANNGFGDIADAAPADVRGRSDSELFPAPLAERLRNNDQRVLGGGEPIVTEESLALDGAERAFVVTKFPLRDATRQIIALGGIWTDVTERKRSEKEVTRAVSQLRTAQRVAHVGSFRWDLRSGEVERSEELYRILGLDPSHTGRTPVLLEENSTLLSKESQARVRAAIEKIRTDGSPYELDLEITRPDGSVAWVAMRGEAERDEAGKVVAITGTSADITALKNLQRLRDEWTSVVAHDLRQPIATILMAAEVLPELHKEMGENERDLVNRMHGSAEALRRMVDDLLDMSLLEASRLRLDRSPFDPRELVKDTLKRLAHMDGINRVEVRGETALPIILADGMRMKQVLINLVSNAIKYGDQHSNIIIEIDHHDGQVTFAVTNHGPGILPDELPRLFDRFARSRSNRGSGIQGLGLGLYIAKGIMQAHGGRLWAESTPGKTTTFFASIPAAVEQRDAA